MRSRAGEHALEVVASTQEKTTTALIVPMHDELRDHLEALASSDEPEQFVMPGMGQQLGSGRNGLSSAFKLIAAKAGVDIQTVQGGGMRMISRRTFHALRHSFTSALANAGVAPELANEAHRPQERVHPRGLHAPRTRNLPCRRGQAPRPERQELNTGKPH